MSVSDGVALPPVNSDTRVIATSINEVPSIDGAVALQSMNDDQTRAVFSTLTVTDPDTQAMLARVTIINGLNRGDFTSASAAGWTRSVSGNDIIYYRYFSATANIGAGVQTSIRALVFQPRNNVPVATTETTTFTVFVNDGIASATNTTTSVNTTGVAPRPAVPVHTAPAAVFVGDTTTIVLPSVNKATSSALLRLLKLKRSK